MRSEVVPDLGVGLCAPAARSPRRRAGWIVTLVIGALACGGTAHQVAIGPAPAKDTHAVLAGPLCGDNRCKCRDDSVRGDGGAGTPDGTSKKRFEVRLGPSPYELWLTINKQTVLYKSLERPLDCFYVDLSTGINDLELRASNPDGVSAAVEIHELGTKTMSWYETFAFSCGTPGVCSFEELDSNKQRYAGIKRHLHDPCGTTKVKTITWDSGKAPDQLHPSELAVRFTLDVYRFAAWKQRGDQTCGEGGGRRAPAGEPEPPPGESMDDAIDPGAPAHKTK